MVRRARRLLDEFLFGVAYSGVSSAPGPAALSYHRVSRGHLSLLPLQHYLMCIADSVCTKT